jgi:D-lactate dehydrogenase (cytochrome)
MPKSEFLSEPIRRCARAAKLWVTDVCVPIFRLAECITETQKDLAASFLPAPIVGHAGAGNFHVLFVLNPSDPREMAEAERLNEQVVLRFA